MGITEHLTCLLRNLYACQEATEPDMEQWTGSRLGKEYVKAAYCHPAYLTYVQSISCKIPGCMKQKLASRLIGEISITSDMQMTPPYGRKWRGTKSRKQSSVERTDCTNLSFRQLIWSMFYRVCGYKAVSQAQWGFPHRSGTGIPTRKGWCVWVQLF